MSEVFANTNSTNSNNITNEMSNKISDKAVAQVAEN